MVAHSDKSWIVEYYEKWGDGSDKYWVIPRESWLVNSPYDHDDAVHQRTLEGIIEVFQKRYRNFGQYWKGHTWRFRNKNSGEVVPWEAIADEEAPNPS